MPLTAGERLGPYEILEPIGAGGMGEVYRARDTRLNRDVAIKVSAERFNERFEREAKVIASLNHPNICHLYDVGPNYLVMELVEGESPQGPMPLDTALNYARQIAAALEEAHEKGVVHRDLKPANLKITPDGTVKVLDFGLAKVATVSATGSSEQSPTLTLAATQAGVILGTAAYMSPEQARGKPLDRRADIWAFGVVLYEMLTGKRLFQGEDVTDTLASVVKERPDLSLVPARVRPLLDRCLEKDPKKRLRHIGDMELLLAEPPAEAPPPPVVQARTPQSKLPWAIAVVLALGLGILAFIHFRPPAVDPSNQPHAWKLAMLLPEKATLRGGGSGIPQISPDGRRLAVVLVTDGKLGLWIRDLDALTGRLLPGTDGAAYPFWSPDSRFVGFFTDGKLKKIDVTGGPALTLCDAPNPRGGTWNQNDVILFAPNQTSGSTLFRVPAEGGNSTPVTVPDPSWPEAHQRAPWFLPDGRHFLFTATVNGGDEKNSVWLGDLDARDIPKTGRRLIPADSNGVYAAGYVLFVRERTLMAQPFDTSPLQTTGNAFPIAEGIDFLPGSSQGLFSASRSGALAYTSGASVAGGNIQLTWFDRSGKPVGTVGPPGILEWPAISPDGNAVAFGRVDEGGRGVDIWLHDLVRGGQSRFTFGAQLNRFPSWSPDGGHIAFNSNRAGIHIYQRATSGVGQDEILDATPGGNKRPTDWSRDGRYIIEEVLGGKTGSDIWALPLFGDKKPFPFLQTEFYEGDARLSPNGQWLAYVSDETKRLEVYVQTFPTPGGKWQVSTSGATHATWSRDGKELYFLGLDGKMMAVEIRGSAQNSQGTKGTFAAGIPKPLFDTHITGIGANTRFDVAKDGRFLIPIPPDTASASVPITVVINWQAGVKR